MKHDFRAAPLLFSIKDFNSPDLYYLFVPTMHSSTCVAAIP